MADFVPVGGAVELADFVPVDGAVELADFVPVGGAVELADFVPVGGAVELADFVPVGGAVELADFVPGAVVSVVFEEFEEARAVDVEFKGGREVNFVTADVAGELVLFGRVTFISALQKCLEQQLIVAFGEQA